jgi:hypothetical protein
MWLIFSRLFLVCRLLSSVCSMALPRALIQRSFGKEIVAWQQRWLEVVRLSPVECQLCVSLA